jgi:hypothetical protein
MSASDRAALLAFAATVGAIVTPADVAEAEARRAHSWRSGVNTSREQARRVRQMARAQARRRGEPPPESNAGEKT